jgi:hypothetical protein
VRANVRGAEWFRNRRWDGGRNESRPTAFRLVGRWESIAWTFGMALERTQPAREQKHVGQLRGGSREARR